MTRTIAAAMAIFCILAVLPVSGFSNSSEQGRVVLSSRELARRATRRVQPALPTTFRVEGTIWVRVLVSSAGSVTFAKAYRGHPVLREASEVAVREWTFDPLLRNGRAVPIRGSIRFDFPIRFESATHEAASAGGFRFPFNNCKANRYSMD